MIGLLCSPQDSHALWLATQLRARGWEVEIVLPEELLIGSSLHLRISTGSSRSMVRLRRGTTFDSSCQGIVNRLTALPPVTSESCRPADSAYLGEEWHAAIVSWLSEITCPVLNRPTGASICGTMFGDGHWRYLAIQVGLPVQPWSTGSGAEGFEPKRTVQSAFVFVVGDKVIDSQCILPVQAHQAIATLSKIGQLKLCCAEFDLSAGWAEFIRVNPLVPFAAGGDPLIVAIEEAFGQS
jgi:hypothetical protein